MPGESGGRPVLLVTSPNLQALLEPWRGQLEVHADVVTVHHHEELERVRELGSRAEALLIFDWPAFLKGPEDFEALPRLLLIQCILAGVDGIPFSIIPSRIKVCSNAGGYSNSVAEHAWALILAAAKLVPAQHQALAAGRVDGIAQRAFVSSMKLLEWGIFGVIGLGGIGSRAAQIARAFGMRVYAITRSGTASFPCDFVGDPSSLDKVLKESDVLLIAAPLTKHTRGLIGRRELALMKQDAILANVARGDIVDEEALYGHLKDHPAFTYVTDVFWYEGGREELRPRYPFFGLPNFLATPHTSGPLALYKGSALKSAVENVLRYFRREPLRNLVRREDYV